MTLTLAPVVHSFTGLVERVMTPEDQADLTGHVAEIRRLHRRAIGDIIEVGRHLTECKKIVGHGGWTAWLDAEFGWSTQTARRFMHVYERSGDPEFNNLLNSELPLSVFYLLAAPSTPNEVHTEVFERIKAGRTVSVASVRSAITPEIPNTPTENVDDLDPLERSKAFDLEAPGLSRRQKKRLSIFMRVIDQISFTCQFGADLKEMPLLNEAQKVAARLRLREARSFLDDLEKRIQPATNG